MCCIGAPVVGIAAWIGLPILRETLDAGKGANTPMEALVQFAFTFEDSDGDFLAPRYVVKSRRDAVLKVRAAFIAERRAFQSAHSDQPAGELRVAGPQPGDPPENFGDLGADRTDVLAYYQWLYPLKGDGGLLGASTGGLPWKAHVVRERDGWRLWSLELPHWCGVKGQAKSGYCLCSP
jgi:hypothetical protein